MSGRPTEAHPAAACSASAPRSGRPGVARLATALLAAMVLPALPAPAQLNDACFVSALNRTARVDEDGVWVLPNVPAGSGPVRVRATCVEDGVVRSGQSPLVVIPARGVVAVPEIDFAAPVPIPASLELVAPVTTLGTAGETVQLQALATYPDGTVADVSVAGSGIDYRSSNPAIATVSPDGLVTAQASGTVLVSALDEGALAVHRLTVTLSGDSDGDGLPDDYELANGLDPNNPVDALDDPDRDGLATGEEVGLGLDPFDPDTDGDTLLDGDELGSIGTDPALFDTDGDGLSDGLEIATGSNPLDPASFNLGAALIDIAVTPESFTLVPNTLLGGTASRQLQVTGLLLDETSLDLTSPSRGTQYLSSDLTVCNFGSEPGRIFAGADGSCEITAENSGFSASAQGRADSFTPIVLAAIDLPPFANDVEIVGDIAFVAGGPAGLHVIDASDRTAPSLLVTLPLAGNANDLRVRDSFVFVAAGSAGLHVVDAQDPAAPVRVATLDTAGDAIDLAASGPFVYIADGTAGLAVVEVDGLGEPTLRGTLDTVGVADGIEVAGGLAVISNRYAATSVVDVADAGAPALIGSIDVGADTYDVAMAPPFAYLASEDDLRVVDLSVPSSPVLRGDFGAGLFMTETILDPGGLLFTTQIRPDTPMPIFRLTDPAAPTLASSIVFSQLGLGAGDGTGLAADGDFIYMTATRGFEADYKPGRFGDTRLYIARYSTPEDAAGLPPIVTIDSPAPGTALREGTTGQAQVAAGDDVAVAAVELLVNGELVATDRLLPYRPTFPVPLDIETATLVARARDYGGNVATSDPVVITVIPDTPPAVEITAPPPGTAQLEDTVVAVQVTAGDDLGVTQIELLVDGAVSGNDTQPPYGFNIRLPLDRSSLTLEARARDTVGQVTTSEEVVVTILPDPPPSVVLTSPPDGETVLEEEQLTVAADATDNRAVARVRFLVNGVEAAVGTSAPYGFELTAPVGETSLTIEAEARDDLGRTASDQVVVFVEPDSGTTVVGRLLDDAGGPVEGAEVLCLNEFSAVTASDGRFTIPDVPTLAGPVQCSAEFLTATGELRRALSRALAPVSGGVTELGDLQPAPFLLYGSFSLTTFGSPSRLALLNPDTADGSILIDTGVAGGISGLAFDSAGRLFATTIEGSAGSRTSLLLELDPDTGAVLAEIGPVTDGGSMTLSAGDLAVEPENDVLYLLRTGEDGQGQAGGLYTVDATSGAASLVGATGTDGSGGLAFTPDGSLYTTRWDPAAGVVYLATLDPTDGSALAEIPSGSSSFDIVSGLAARPSDGLLLGSLRSSTGVVVIDPGIGLLTDIGFSNLGRFDDLAFRAAPPPEQQTTVVGRVVDDSGDPVEGALVTVRNVFWAVSGGDGTFTLTGVPVSFGDVVVSIPPSSLSSIPAESQPTPPLAGSATDVGDIELQVGAVSIVEPGGHGADGRSGDGPPP